MVHYIRFLKPPGTEIGRQKTSVKALVTVTTDLGDVFYDRDIALYATLLGKDNRRLTPWATVLWKSHMRATWIGIEQKPSHTHFNPFTFLVSVFQTVDADSLCDHLSPVLSARCGVPMVKQPLRSATVKRCLRTNTGIAEIFEGMEESIARHIWDASIGLMKYLDCIMHRDIDRKGVIVDSLLSLLLKRGLTILELGSGCGIVGLYLASVLSHCKCVLTDLPEAMELLDLNIRDAMLGLDSKAETAVFDWEKPVPDSLMEKSFDLLIISDCTYNCDTVPALVNSLVSITTASRQALILVSMKVRHESEEIFFELMSESGFGQLSHETIPLPNNSAGGTDGPPESIEVFTFQSNPRSASAN